MTSNYDNTLDICIGLIMQGGTVEDCLRRFPEHADELEGDLRPLAASLAGGFTPNTAAKDRARLQLQAAMAGAGGSTIDAGPAPSAGLFDRVRDAWRSWSAPAGAPRWAATAAVAVLVVLVGGSSVVAASSGALPGDALYPVKRTTENVSLAFTFSETGKAERHLALAERRANEIAKISASANSGLVASTTANLEAHVASASQIITSIESDSTAASLTARLRTSSSVALVTLQGSQGDTQSLASASAAYGQALEETAARQEDSYVAAPPGSIRMQVTDPPPSGVDRLFLEFERVEVYLPAGEHSRWVTVFEGSREIDLIRAANAPIVLAQANVESGRYSRIRLTLASSRIVLGETELPVVLASDTIEIRRPFAVNIDDLTTITLDIDSAASLTGSGLGGFSISPVISVLSREPAPPSASPTPTVHPSVTPTQQPTTEISGVVDVVDATHISINGLEITLGPDTVVDGEVEEGTEVTVHAVLGDAGGLLADTITVGSPPSAASTPTATPVPATPQPVRTVIEGVVGSIGADTWEVDGRSVMVDAQTVIELGASLGIRVRVEGVLESDNSIRATRIVPVLLPGLIPTPTPPTQPNPTASPAPGATPSPTPTFTPTATPGAVAVQFTGRVNSIVGATWTVGDRQVLVTTSTSIEGLPLVGKTATVTGILADDGTVIANRITFPSLFATPTPTSTTAPETTPSPTPITTPTPFPTATPTSTATPLSSPTPPPTATASPAPTVIGTPTVVTVTGEVLHYDALGGELIVDAEEGPKTVEISGTTNIIGLVSLVVGAHVTFTGAPQPDGSILASSITVLDS